MTDEQNAPATVTEKPGLAASLQPAKQDDSAIAPIVPIATPETKAQVPPVAPLAPQEVGTQPTAPAVAVSSPDPSVPAPEAIATVTAQAVPEAATATGPSPETTTVPAETTTVPEQPAEPTIVPAVPEVIGIDDVPEPPSETSTDASVRTTAQEITDAELDARMEIIFKKNGLDWTGWKSKTGRG